jgi:uncharacterized membrane protein YdjX (TVP38/TMEM64 family)
MNKSARAMIGSSALLLLVLVSVEAHRSGVAAWVARLPAGISQGSFRHWTMFLLLQVCVAAIGFLPASFIAITAGATYGMWHGFLLSAVGTLIGGWLAFLLSRSAWRPWIERMVVRDKRFVRFDDAVAADGWRFVCLLRMSPVMPFALTSYGLGLTRLGHRPFIIGTLASLPALSCYVAVGAFGRASLSFGTHSLDLVHYLLLAAGLAATVLSALRIRALVSKALASN